MAGDLPGHFAMSRTLTPAAPSAVLATGAVRLALAAPGLSRFSRLRREAEQAVMAFRHRRETHRSSPLWSLALGQPGKAEKAAGPFDGVTSRKMEVEHRHCSALLEAHELNVELIEALPRFGHIHGPTQARADMARAAAPAPLPVIVRNTGLRFVDHRKNSGRQGRFRPL